MKKVHVTLILLLIFVLIVMSIILMDAHFGDSLLMKDFLTLFVREGMEAEKVTELLGNSLGDVGSGACVLEYALPFEHRFYVTLTYDTRVLHVSEGPDPYPFRGFLLPVIILGAAVLEMGTYFLIIHCQKKKQMNESDCPQ